MFGKFLISLISINIIILTGCGRNASNEEPKELDNVQITQPEIKDPTLITPTDPFKNQPNEFCTVIRKLDISYYDAKNQVEDANKFPKKYCLLDVCLENVDPNGFIINLGDDDEVVTTAFELIKVFETTAETKAYVEQYKIVDVKWED